MYKYKTQPLKHQLEALAKSATKKNFAYFMEMGCFDGETEFLTNRGWVRFKDFDLGRVKAPFLVAQAEPDAVNPWVMNARFVEPISFIKKEATTFIEAEFGSTYNNGNGKKDAVHSPVAIRCTPDHLFNGVFISKPLFGRTRKYVKKAMENFPIEFAHKKLNENINILKSGQRKHLESHDSIYIPRRVGEFYGFQSGALIPDIDINSLSEAELRVQVAVMADGTFPNRWDNKCDMYFLKKRKADRLKMLLNRAGIPYAYETKEKERPSSEDRSILYIFHFMAPIKTKVYTEEWYTLPLDKLRIIASECIFWDGSITTQTSGYVTFYSVEKESADFIQYAIWASGGCPRILNPSIAGGVYSVRCQMGLLGDRLREDIGTLGLEKFNQYKSDVLPEFSLVSNIILSTPKSRTRVKKVKSNENAYCFRVPSGYLWLRRNGYIFSASNSGKTKVMIDNTGMLYDKGAITGCLVLAPKGVYRNWADVEIPKHLPDDIPREVLVWDAAKSIGYKHKLQKAIRDWDRRKLQFLIFNVESLISQTGKELIVEFIRKHEGDVMALVDESTCIKNHKAKRTKIAIEVGKECKARRIATGSPITNSPLDLFSQCAFLDKNLLGFGSYYAFKNTFADVEKIPNRNGQYYEKILRYKNLDMLSHKVGRFSHRVTKKECLDLPDKIYMTRDVELTDEQKKIYNEMAKYQFALMQEGESFKEMSVSVVLTKFLRLHQILCGTFVSDDGELKRIPNHRLDALKEVLDETSGKVIIWATYIADIEAISDMLEKEYGKDSFVTYYGATSSDDRAKAVEVFQDESSPVRFFLGNTQTAGRGITLTAANTVVYYSNNFSLELRQQSEDRAHRLGQKNPVTYVDLVVRHSLDEKIIQSLINKRDIANEVLKDDLTSWISLEPSED